MSIFRLISFFQCLDSIVCVAVMWTFVSIDDQDAKNVMERHCPEGINEGTRPLKNTKAPLTLVACVPFIDPALLHERLKIKYSIRFFRLANLYCGTKWSGLLCTMRRREKKELAFLGKTFHTRYCLILFNRK